MSTILIITLPGDVHAHAVAWALRQKGQEVRRWYPAELAQTPLLTRINSHRTPTVELDGPDGEFTTEALHSVWFRRFSAPHIPDSLPDGDRRVAQRETLGFLHGVNQLIGPTAFWANPLSGHRIASLKMPQLAAAQRVGLRIPDTVLTNDTKAVQQFIDDVQGRVIYKPFYPAVWKGVDKNRTTITTLIERDQLDNPESLQYCPGIFQTFIPKAYELRVTIFGRTCIAAKIFDQDEIDWRYTHKMQLEPYLLPEVIEAKLFQLMDALGIVMGTLDMIVTAEGEYIFLEVNEQGQFLWLEQMNPEIRLLEPFAQFLIAAHSQFRWSANSTSNLRFSEYFDTDTDAQLQFKKETDRLKQSDIRNDVVVNDLTELGR